jgi:hypothetical protein
MVIGEEAAKGLAVCRSSLLAGQLTHNGFARIIRKRRNGAANNE